MTRYEIQTTVEKKKAKTSHVSFCHPTGKLNGP